jgi:23S rRNA pseudouridine1911/1915/1917 synthase
MRLDAWLRRRYPGLSRQHVIEAIDEGLVRRPGGGRLRKGDRIAEPPDCASLDRHLERLLAGNAALKVPVLSETDDVVVVDKPAGMPGHPVHLLDFDTVCHWALARYPEIRGWCTQSQPTLTPHRLDTGTSGVLLVAKSAAAYRQWRRWFSGGQVQKQYLAWCWGVPASDRWRVALGLVHDTSDRRRMAVAGDRRKRRVLPAVTEASVEVRLQDRFLCRLTCHTGVMHQVRVHMSASGYPLLGDELYDAAFATRPSAPPHVLLRAVQLSAPDFTAAAPGEAFAALFAAPV